MQKKKKEKRKEKKMSWAGTHSALAAETYF